MKRVPLTPEHRAKISASVRKALASAEMRKRLSDNAQKRSADPNDAFGKRDTLAKAVAASQAASWLPGSRAACFHCNRVSSRKSMMSVEIAGGGKALECRSARSCEARIVQSWGQAS